MFVKFETLPPLPSHHQQIPRICPGEKERRGGLWFDVASYVCAMRLLRVGHLPGGHIFLDFWLPERLTWTGDGASLVILTKSNHQSCSFYFKRQYSTWSNQSFQPKRLKCFVSRSTSPGGADDLISWFNSWQSHLRRTLMFLSPRGQKEASNSHLSFWKSQESLRKNWGCKKQRRNLALVLSSHSPGR